MESKNMNNFSKIIIFQATNLSVYDALTNSIPEWWTEMFEGISNEKGQSFTIRFGTEIFKTMKVEELLPGKKVIWKVTDSLIDLPELKNKTEWINTSIVWEINSIDGKTTLDLTHHGLTPEVECFEICENGWHTFTNSLRDFIHTGVGKPFNPDFAVD